MFIFSPQNKAIKSREELNNMITREMIQLVENRADDQPLLGYDWIAGVSHMITRESHDHSRVT